MPRVLLLGTADNDPHHHSLPDQPEAMAQGPYRLARGKKFFATAQAQAQRLQTPFNWTLSFAPDVAHSDKNMAPFAAKIFRSEEHTSELQSLMRTSYAVFCLKKKN